MNSVIKFTVKIFIDDLTELEEYITFPLLR
jgi:hypothetical protein